MSRLIFLFAIIVIVYWIIKSYIRTPPKDVVPESAEDMVRCRQCGVHLPKGESIKAGGNYYCCEAHRHQHEGSHS